MNPEAETIYFQWGRIQENSDWILPVLVLAVLVFLAVRIYRYDAKELVAWRRWALMALRVAALAVLFVIYLQPQWRASREVKQNSQVVIMVDTSLSMQLPNAEGDSVSREQTVKDILQKTPLVEELRKKHDVILTVFDTAPPQKVVTFPKLEETDGENTEEATEDWATALEARGVETRLSDSVRSWIQANQTAPLAGIVLFSDGVQNAGGDVDSAVLAAESARVPIYTVGFGSALPMENIRLYDLEAPVRVQPGDPFTITAMVQGYGLSPEGTASAEKLHSVKVELSVGGTLLETKEIFLSDDGKVTPVRFEITPTELGKFTYTLRAQPRPREQMLDDNVREADVEVVDRKTKVLIFAGGPTREYQFLVPTLFRDKSMETDVYLQSARPGISQEADKILDDFPDKREEMFAYDCVIAIDPNWKDLTDTQINLLDEWIARQGGGILLIAGAVYMGETVGGWIESPGTAKIRAIYPVEFIKRFSVFRQETYAARDPWPIDFTMEGVEANFLKLEDSISQSQTAWAEFPGVYGYFPTKGPKPGATVLAWFSDPSKREGENLPVLAATQFYGAGRVLYLGTGEMWRLRAKNPEYFVRLYTQLTRYVAQGRMMQQSTRGRLMIARDRYTLGESIEIRAQLMDSQMRPLSVPETSLEAFLPDGRLQRVPLRADADQPGLYAGTLAVLSEGIVRLEVPLDGTEERLSRRVEVALPDLERENPQRNRLLLERLAAGTGGVAFSDASEAVQRLPDAIRDRTRTMTLPAAVSPEYQREFLQWLMIAAVVMLCLEWLLRRLSKLA